MSHDIIISFVFRNLDIHRRINLDEYLKMLSYVLLLDIPCVIHVSIEKENT